jgi:hypothetical protein
LKATGVPVVDDLNDTDPGNDRTTPRVEPWAAVFTSAPGDMDLDGCTNAQELGSSRGFGGLRNPYSFWDFFDVPTGTTLQRDRAVSGADVGAVAQRLGSNDATPGDFYRDSDPLSTPNPAVSPSGARQNYHPAYDRGGSITNASPWHLQPPDGAISGGDISAVVVQFGNSCVGG